MVVAVVLAVPSDPANAWLAAMVVPGGNWAPPTPVMVTMAPLRCAS